jgi:ParB/RepB/Spo0J family partition protein
VTSIIQGQLLQNLPVDRITCAPQVREHFDPAALAGLAQSMREVGLQQPIRVRTQGDGWVVVDGERRLRAARDVLGWSTIPAIIEERELADAEVIQRQLIANVQRASLRPVEKAKAIDGLMRGTNWTAAQTAARLGISPASVSKLLALLVLPAEAQQSVDSGDLGASTAYEIASTRDGALREQLLEDVKRGKLTRDRVTHRTRRARRGPPRQRARVRRNGVERVVLELGERNSITVTGSDLTVSAAVARLEQLVGRLRQVGDAGMALRDAATQIGKPNAAEVRA